MYDLLKPADKETEIKEHAFYYPCRNKMSKYMCLQIVYFYKGNTFCKGETFCKRGAPENRVSQAL